MRTDDSPDRPPARWVTVALGTALVLLAAAVLTAMHLLGPGRGASATTTEPPSWPGLAADTVDLTPDSLAGLTPELAERFLGAQDAAAEAGLSLHVTSGARTAEEQQRLLDDAVTEHGSPEEATRWVLPPEQSAHVQGLAIDVGPHEARAWLAEHGARFGLCQVYENEPWHVEPLTDPGGTCPPLVRDASALG
ncbi:M15 family metallopeptidase [Georgenia sp. H159]|uniref:M15 family metallopeptidase n=1 Tax=Georgenia sp. H159 TaxID=3076115 RepID=UPI002D784281|nr:M15 family metallopeptidase [Georgenia sp. H159]